MNERLYRSVDDRVIAGVCGGLATRLALDPSLVRVVWAVLALVTGIFPLLVVYVIMAAVVPEDPRGFAGAWPSPTPPAPSWVPEVPAPPEAPAEPDVPIPADTAADPVAATGAGAPGPAAPPTPWNQGALGPPRGPRAAGARSSPRPSSVGSPWWRSGSTSSSATGSRSTGASSGRPASLPWELIVILAALRPRR